MEQVADPLRPAQFNYAEEKEIFEKTFKLLAKALAEKAFAFKNKAGTELAAGFSLYHFESITIGLQPVLSRIDADDAAQIEELRTVLTAAKLDGEFVRLTTGGGKNSPGPLNARIVFVEQRLRDAFPG
jgi:hypothetical protein